jgi:hypothetical protein
VLAVQVFIPEVAKQSRDESLLIDVKRRYLQDWRNAVVPVIMDIDPGYDGHKVFGEKAAIWGNNQNWRNIQMVSGLRRPMTTRRGVQFLEWLHRGVHGHSH